MPLPISLINFPSTEKQTSNVVIDVQVFRRGGEMKLSVLKMEIKVAS